MKRPLSIVSVCVWLFKGTVQGEPLVTDGGDLGIQVVGTIVQRQSSENVALLKVSGAVKAVKAGHPIGSTYRVVSIAPEYVEIIEAPDRVYRIQPDKFAATSLRKAQASQPSPGQELHLPGDFYREDGFERQRSRIKMTAIYRDKLVKEDLARVLMQATVEPHLENGQIVGFKISQIDAGSIYDKAGLRNGDIITQINDQELSSVANSIKLLQSLKGVNHMEVDVRRGEQKMRLTVEVH